MEEYELMSGPAYLWEVVTDDVSEESYPYWDCPFTADEEVDALLYQQELEYTRGIAATLRKIGG